MKVRELVVLSGHVWTAPPDRQSLDLPMLERLADLLDVRLSVIVRGREARPATYHVDHGAVAYLPDRWSTPRFLWSGGRAARAAIRASSAPLVLTSDVLGAGLGLLSRRPTRAPMIVQVQGDILAPGPEYGGRLKRLVMGWVTRRAVRAADGIRCLNEHIAQRVLELSPHGLVRVIGSRVDVERFTARPGDRNERSAVILCVGSLNQIKNQRVLVDALPFIHEEFPDAELWFAGTGPTETALRRRASEKRVASAVHFKGKVPHAEVPRLLHEASLLALPSLSEGEPRAVLEAQAAGVPVVVSDIPGTRGIVEDGITGRTVPDFNPSTWAVIIRDVLADGPQRATLAANALERVRRENALEAWLERSASFLRDVAEAS